MTPQLASRIRIVDGALRDPDAYRAAALAGEFRSYDFGHCVFHGINAAPPSTELINRIHELRPELVPLLSFLRKSPLGQIEPHYIHTDIDMGDWSAILYLNPSPPAEDGTSFWTHRETGAIESTVPHERSGEGRDPSAWILRDRVAGRFNRLLLFPSSYFHSRAIHDNWGAGDEARLIQVVFGKGVL